ncbi:hypothetical protein E8E13_011444 [Curvularia kusanoi]|uniref:Uncharacterized protein n=1 Tax=Curvularia kusanoi TaxID=90978 RepID=A0A9P4TLA8_CURKU|nr:hypothetical protein E8E13_011444 [Curvularia kusanoi]
MAQPPPIPAQVSTSAQDATNAFFKRSLQLYNDHVVNTLSTDPNDPAATQTVQTLIAQLNYNYQALDHLINAIQARIYRDVNWVNAALAIYNKLSATIPPNFSAPGTDMKGACLVQHFMMKALQTQFDATMAQSLWSVGLVAFLGRLGASRQILGSLTPGIAFHILDEMVKSERLFSGQNFDICLDFILLVGSFLDAGHVELFSHRLQHLQDRATGRSTVAWMAVCWLLRLRKFDWSVGAAAV